MDKNNLIKQLVGKWIIQNNFYSLNNRQKKSYKNIYRVNWSYYSSNELTKFIKTYKSKKQINHYIDGFNLIKSINESQDFTHYSFLFHPSLDQGILIKIDNFSSLITQSIFYYSNKTIIYEHNLNQKTRIFEKSYFLSNKVKLTKCHIKINNFNQGSYFCSQIKMN